MLQYSALESPRARQFYDNVILPNAGISLLVMSQFLNSIMILTCKLLEFDKDFEQPLHPIQILFARMFLTYLGCVLYMVTFRNVADAPFGPRDQRLLLLSRGFVGFFGVFGLYYSLQYLSISDATSITFLVPMVTAFFAWIALGERYSWVEAVCSVVSLGGILLVAKPDFLFGEEVRKELPGDKESGESSSSSLRVAATVMGLIGVCAASMVYVILRKIGKSCHPLISVSYFALSTCIVCFVTTMVLPSMSFQIPSTFKQWFLMFLIGVSGFFMQFCLAAGLQREKAGKSALMIYLNIVFALVWDLVFFGHLPGLLSLLGSLIIIACGFIVVKHNSGADSVMEDDDIEAGKYQAPETIAMDFIISDDED